MVGGMEFLAAWVLSCVLAVWNFQAEFSDLYRFPPAWGPVTKEFARAHRKAIQEKYERHHPESWEFKFYFGWWYESLLLQEAHEYLEKARDESPYLRLRNDREFNLDRFKQACGPVNWYFGRLPPPVPLWRFRTEDR